MYVHSDLPIAEGAKRCPFCGAPEVYYNDHGRSFGPDNHTVHCNVVCVCGAEGPSVNFEFDATEPKSAMAAAIEAWDCRSIADL